jgi:polyisoprenyl-phosphate glycosyltransferase
MLQKKNNKIKANIEILIPIYNEEDCINELLTRLLKLKNNQKDFNISFIFINDGSIDRSFEKLSDYADKYQFIKIINFSRNFGHQIAVSAGLDFINSSTDYVLIIDADLQDPPEILPLMYNKAIEGFDVVYGKRLTRKGENIFKKITAKLFYRLINKMCAIDIPYDTGDFRLISKLVIKNIKLMREKHRFIRGMIPWIGFKNIAFEYHREERFAGDTKYPLKKMIKFAKDAIFSFSSTPLQIANYIGFLVVLISLVGGFFLLYLRIFTEYNVPGITTVILTILFLGGIQIIMIGIIGEYVGRIFEESKERPLYIISDTKNIDNYN